MLRVRPMMGKRGCWGGRGGGGGGTKGAWSWAGVRLQAQMIFGS